MASATFQNIYYKRAVAAAKPCYMCYRPTTTFLATINTVDFFPTCDAHLKDPGFATLIEPSPESPSSSTKKYSEEEIRRIKEEWEERQRQKKEKEKDDKDKEKDKGKGKAEEEKKKSPAPKSPPPPPAPIPVPGSAAAAAAARAKHEKYTLHRDVWAMRQAEHRKRRQTAAAKEVAPKLPGAPRGAPA